MTTPAARPRWTDETLERVGRCPVCDAEGGTILHDALDDRLDPDDAGRWTIRACSRCESAYLDPRPTRGSLPLAYERYHTHASLSDPWRPRSTRWRRLRAALGNGYRNRRFGSRLAPSSAIGGLLPIVCPPLCTRIDGALRQLPIVRPGMRLLDVGCGNGQFLATARGLGWEVEGVEPDPRSRTRALEHGLRVHGDLDAVAGRERSFAAITLNHVIEHVPDPHGLLRALHRLLEPGGFLYVEAPNLRSLGHRRFGRAWLGLDPPRHLVLFHWNSLEAAVRGAGFVRVRRHPRAHVLASVARDSEALRGGRRTVAAAAWLGFARMRLLVDPEATEFVSLSARRPEEP